MWQTMTKEEVIKKLKVDIKKGLSDNEAKKRKEIYGPNKLDEKKQKNILIRFINQFKDFMIITLIIAAIISAIVSYVEGTKEYLDSIIILFIVTLNSIMGLVQESKAEKALEALKKLSAPSAKVKRNGKIITIDCEDVVPGDYIIIETGAYIPADARLINSNNLKVEESALTGETVPVIKDSNVVLDNKTNTADMINMVFTTTNVVGGHAEAIVTRNWYGY